MYLIPLVPSLVVGGEGWIIDIWSYGEGGGAQIIAISAYWTQNYKQSEF